MTHTTSEVDRESGGSVVSVYATLDVTSLDNAASESFDPASEFNFSDVLGVTILGLENAGTYQAEFDHLDGTTLNVQNVDGTDPTSGTDVGEVRVRVDGDKGP
jgi:hypothetical protein